MASIAYKRRYHIHEAIGATSVNESYMISDPESGCGLAAVDEKTGIGVKIGKAFLDKSLLPVKLEMVSSEGSNILEMYQPVSLIKPTFTVKTADGRILCVLKSNSCLLKPFIEVLDERGQLIGSIKGNWRFNSFEFKDISGKDIAKITHCYGGFLREALTTADDYDVEMLAETPDPSLAMVVLSSAIAIDTWYHE
jgi:uncharacterized protein YxjI